MMRRSACLSLVLTALSLSACALDGAEVPEEVSQSSAALGGSGTSAAASMNGIVRISGSSALGTVQGALMSPTMVLTSRYGLRSVTGTIDLTVETRPNSAGSRERVRVVDAIELPERSLVLLRLASSLTERPVTLDTRPYTGPTSVRCQQLLADGSERAAVFSATPLQGLPYLLLDGAASTVVLDTASGGDFGLACGDAGRVKGLLVYANPPSPGTGARGLVASVTDLVPLLAAQEEVFAVRDSGRATPFSLYVIDKGQRRCLDVSPFVRVAECDPRRKEQEFYFDDRGQNAGGGNAIMSAALGKCLSGLNLRWLPAVSVEVQACDQTRQQNFAMTFTPSGHVQYVHGTTNRCLTNASGPVQLTRDCSESASRNWLLSWH
ncbi:MAG: RICIN domain-containing protein [Myxococcales bacterium]|nr:RICIN domain-containing protein [Myxococcales bacterium]